LNDDERAIRDLVATWMAASQAGDLETVLGLMADDVVFIVPGREPFGKEAFAAASQTMKNVRSKGRMTFASSKCWATGHGCAII
jgi:uncharacterized protein (TIGR02246 family)